MRRPAVADLKPDWHVAGFKTHITTSTTLGVAYGTAGFLWLDEATVPRSMLAAGLCGVSGMLPDLDSDSGVPVREMTAFAAAVVPMLMMDRFRQLGWPQELMVFAGGLIYVAIRFGVVELFKRYTVHRGMWHSIPAAGVVGLLAYLVCSTDNPTVRYFQSGAVVLGFLSHLVLDEIWSLDVRGGKLRVKRSFGTALKLWSSNWWANFSVYAKLVVLGLLVAGDPVMMKNLRVDPDELLGLARGSIKTVKETVQGAVRELEEATSRGDNDASGDDRENSPEPPDVPRRPRSPLHELVPIPRWARR